MWNRTVALHPKAGLDQTSRRFMGLLLIGERAALGHVLDEAPPSLHTPVESKDRLGHS